MFTMEIRIFASKTIGNKFFLPDSRKEIQESPLDPSSSMFDLYFICLFVSKLMGSWCNDFTMRHGIFVICIYSEIYLMKLMKLNQTKCIIYNRKRVSNHFFHGCNHIVVWAR